MLKTNLKFLLSWSAKLFGPALIAIMGIIYLMDHYRLVINASPSLPNFAFWVEMGKLPSERGEYVLFDAPSNRYYDKPFVKQISGLPGDLIENRHSDYFVNGVFAGTAKLHSKTGEPLEPGPTGVIPDFHYFATTPHKDSYDSRYADIGFVPSVLVLGTAHPIL